jgi:hypothetical protein
MLQLQALDLLSQTFILLHEHLILFASLISKVGLCVVGPSLNKHSLDHMLDFFLLHASLQKLFSSLDDSFPTFKAKVKILLLLKKLILYLLIVVTELFS